MRRGFISYYPNQRVLPTVRRVCKECGKEYRGQRDDDSLCSYDCYRRWRNRRKQENDLGTNRHIDWSSPSRAGTEATPKRVAEEVKGGKVAYKVVVYTVPSGDRRVSFQERREGESFPRYLDIVFHRVAGGRWVEATDGVSDSNRLHPTGYWWEVTEWGRGKLAIQGKVEVAQAIQRYLGREGEDLIPFARSFVGELGERELTA